jgi:nucleoside-diphosphate-sugar epimerase
MNFLVTGANGFVGSALCEALSAQGYEVCGAVRSAKTTVEKCKPVIIGEFDDNTDWGNALSGMEVVIHLAARVHVMSDDARDPLAEFRRTNTAGTENLARQAARAGVKRFVYVSSIKVNGESTPLMASAAPSKIPLGPLFLKGGGSSNMFTETDLENPQDPYGISKWEAEQALHRVVAETGLEVVIVRPPLVYGAGVKGNFVQMLKVLAKGIPLPLASVNNRRSLVYVGNLVNALILCSTHHAAVGQTYLVSDGEDISTPDLLRQLGMAMGHPAHLFPCPQELLKLAGRLTGKSDQIERLLGSLQVDSNKICRELDWMPPYTLDQGLRATADRFHGRHS